MFCLGAIETMNRDDDSSAGAVGPEPDESSVLYTEVYESSEKDVVAHYVEGCTRVEEDEDVKGTGVGRKEGYFEDLGLGLCRDEEFKGCERKGRWWLWYFLRIGGRAAVNNSVATVQS